MLDLTEKVCQGLLHDVMWMVATVLAAGVVPGPILCVIGGEWEREKSLWTRGSIQNSHEFQDVCSRFSLKDSYESLVTWSFLCTCSILFPRATPTPANEWTAVHSAKQLHAAETSPWSASADPSESSATVGSEEVVTCCNCWCMKRTRQNQWISKGCWGCWKEAPPVDTIPSLDPHGSDALQRWSAQNRIRLECLHGFLLKRLGKIWQKTSWIQVDYMYHHVSFVAMVRGNKLGSWERPGRDFMALVPCAGLILKWSAYPCAPRGITRPCQELLVIRSCCSSRRFSTWAGPNLASAPFKKCPELQAASRAGQLSKLGLLSVQLQLFQARLVAPTMQGTAQYCKGLGVLSSREQGIGMYRVSLMEQRITRCKHTQTHNWFESAALPPLDLPLPFGALHF